MTPREELAQQADFYGMESLTEDEQAMLLAKRPRGRCICPADVDGPRDIDPQCLVHGTLFPDHELDGGPMADPQNHLYRVGMATLGRLYHTVTQEACEYDNTVSNQNAALAHEQLRAVIPLEDLLALQKSASKGGWLRSAEFVAKERDRELLDTTLRRFGFMIDDKGELVVDEGGRKIQRFLDGLQALSQEAGLWIGHWDGGVCLFTKDELKERKDEPPAAVDMSCGWKTENAILQANQQPHYTVTYRGRDVRS